MVEDVKILMGDCAANYSDALISLILEQTLLEVETYCNRSSLDQQLINVAERITIIKLNRMNTEGLASQTYSGVSESYIDGYPAEIMNILNKKRRIKML